MKWTPYFRSELVFRLVYKKNQVYTQQQLYRRLGLSPYRWSKYRDKEKKLTPQTITFLQKHFPHIYEIYNLDLFKLLNHQHNQIPTHHLRSLHLHSFDSKYHLNLIQRITTQEMSWHCDPLIDEAIVNQHFLISKEPNACHQLFALFCTPSLFKWSIDPISLFKEKRLLYIPLSLYLYHHIYKKLQSMACVQVVYESMNESPLLNSTALYYGYRKTGCLPEFDSELFKKDFEFYRRIDFQLEALLGDAAKERTIAQNNHLMIRLRFGTPTERNIRKKKLFRNLFSDELIQHQSKNLPVKVEKLINGLSRKPKLAS